MVKVCSNFKAGWSESKIKNMTKRNQSKYSNATWAEIIESDDFVKPFFDIDMKIDGEEEEEVDYEEYVQAIYEDLSDKILDIQEKNNVDLNYGLLCATANGWNKQKESHYVSLHLSAPDMKIQYKNMNQLIDEYKLEGPHETEMGFEYKIDMNVYGKEKICFRLINNDKPLDFHGTRAGRKKVKFLTDMTMESEGEKEDWLYVVGDCLPDVPTLEYDFTAVKNHKAKAEVQDVSSGVIKFNKHYIEQWIKKSDYKVVRRSECENCVYFNLSDKTIQDRFCEFKKKDNSRNHGDPEAHAVFTNYLIRDKNSGRLFQKCYCPDGTCPSSSKEITAWRERGAWERAFKDEGETSMVDLMNEQLAHIRFEDGKQTYITNYASVRDMNEIDKTNLKDCYIDEGWFKEDKDGSATSTRVCPIDLWRYNRKHLKLNKRVFEPESPIITEENNLNLWKGYNINKEEAINFIESYGWEQAKEDWGFYKNHIEEHLCDGDLDLSNYVINWMSHILQKPAKKTEVMLVIKGKEGIGKSAIFAKGSQFQKIIAASDKQGPFYQISETGRLFSRFNDRMKDCRYVVLNEALFAGDKKTLSQLKELITDPIITTEKKFGNCVNLDQFFDFVALTNYQYASPFTTSSRRWQGVQSGDSLSKEGKSPEEKKKISEYFVKLFGVPSQVVAFYLYERNIEEFNPPNDIVINNFMVEQSEYGRSPVEKYVIAMADTGYIRYRGEVDYGGGLLTAWIPNFLFLFLDAKTLFQCFKAFCKAVGVVDKHNSYTEQTIISEIKAILGKDLFKKRSGVMEKGLDGFSGCGILKTREYLSNKYKIAQKSDEAKVNISWSSDLDHCSGCYKRFWKYIRIDNHSDKMRVKGGTLKNKERRRFPFSTFDSEWKQDERGELGLVNKYNYGFMVSESNQWTLYNKRGEHLNGKAGLLNMDKLKNDGYKGRRIDNVPKDLFEKGKQHLPLGEKGAKFCPPPDPVDLYDSDIEEELQAVDGYCENELVEQKMCFNNDDPNQKKDMEDGKLKNKKKDEVLGSEEDSEDD